MGCRLCLMPGGPGIGPRKGGVFDDDEAYFEHLEMEHDVPVCREHETEDDARGRVAGKNPRMGSPLCRCPACAATRKVAR